MDKLKNFLYDISDIVVCLVIIAVIFFSVSFKISDVMAFSPSDEKNQLSDNIIPEQPVDETPDATTNPDAKPDVTPTPTPEPDQPVVETVTIVVQAGTPGYGIGKLLEDNGLIDDVNTFVVRVDEMGYATKLQSGTFYLKTDMDLDTMIQVLAGNRP